MREPLVFASEFRFHLRDIAAEIVVRLYRSLHSGTFVARRSHDLSIPQFTAPASQLVNENAHEQEGEALHIAVDEMVSTYNAARAQGLTPAASWLKANDSFH